MHIRKLFEKKETKAALYDAFLREAYEQGISFSQEAQELLARYYAPEPSIAPTNMRLALGQSSVNIAYTALNEYTLVFVAYVEEKYFQCYTQLGDALPTFKIKQYPEHDFAPLLRHQFDLNTADRIWYPADFCTEKRCIVAIQKDAHEHRLLTY